MAKDKKKNDASPSATASVNARTKTTAAANAISNSLMKKFERLAAIIDDSLESENLMAGGLCSNMVASDKCSGSIIVHNTTADTTASTFNSIEDNNNRSFIGIGDVDGGASTSSVDEMNGNFASWLASQEFDASAIVWNGDGVNPQELGDELDAASAIGRSCEYSPDEFPDDGGDAGHCQRQRRQGKEDAQQGDADSVGYVSIADVRPNKWMSNMLPPAVSDVWDKVSSAPLQCLEPPPSVLAHANAKLKTAADKAARREGTSTKRSSRKPRGGRRAGGAARDASVAQQQQQERYGTCPDQNQSKQSDENLSSIFRSPKHGGGGGTTKKKMPPGILKSNSSYCSLASKPSSGSKPDGVTTKTKKSSTKHPNDAEEGRQQIHHPHNEDGEAEKLIENVQKSRTPLSSSYPNEMNLDDGSGGPLLSQVSGLSSHAESSHAQWTKDSSTFTPFSCAENSSVATPLVGENLFLETDNGIHRSSGYATNTTPDISCTYSASPGGPGVENGRHRHHTNVNIVETRVRSGDGGGEDIVSLNNTPGSSFHAVQLPLDGSCHRAQEEDDMFLRERPDCDDGDTHGMNDDDYDDTTPLNSSNDKMKKVKGRRRRRMRLK